MERKDYQTLVNAFNLSIPIGLHSHIWICSNSFTIKKHELPALSLTKTLNIDCCFMWSRSHCLTNCIVYILPFASDAETVCQANATIVRPYIGVVGLFAA